MSATIKLAARLGVHIDFTYPGHVHDMGQAFWDNVLKSLDAGPGFHLIRSRPSVVETEFRLHPSRTVIAHALGAMVFASASLRFRGRLGSSHCSSWELG
jgi:hypothetical protein